MRACQPKDLKWREWRSVGGGGKRGRERESAHARGRERERESALAPPFMFFFPPPGPALCKLGLARSAVCSTWSLHSGPWTFFCSFFTGFSLPCLLATAILDSFSLFYLPNNTKWDCADWESHPGLEDRTDFHQSFLCLTHFTKAKSQNIYPFLQRDVS